MIWQRAVPYKMGSKQSSTGIPLPAISKEQWREISLSGCCQWRVCHGHYRLLQNTLTADRIEQYSLSFDGEGQFQQYLQSFRWREREEDLVPARYVECLRVDGLCAGRVKATVYLPHTPYRLSSLEQISLPEGLYLLSVALAGFQKLAAGIGFFRASADMVGVDAEGRVRVWLNSNFSSNFLYGPYYVEGRVDRPQEVDEGAMVAEIIAMVDGRIRYREGEGVKKFRQFVGEGRVGFSSTQRAIKKFSKQCNISVPSHFFSLLRQSSFSESHDPAVSSNQTSKGQINSHGNQFVHYISPALESSQQGWNSTHHVHSDQHRTTSNVALEKEDFREGLGDTTGETILRGVYQNSSTPMAVMGGQLPKVNFNYGLARQQCFLTPSPSHSSTLRNSLATPHFSLSLPLSLLPEHKTLSRAATKRMTFSDKNREHFLDDELVEDMAKYLQ